MELEGNKPPLECWEITEITLIVSYKSASSFLHSFTIHIASYFFAPKYLYAQQIIRSTFDSLPDSRIDVFHNRVGGYVLAGCT
jgi:hypothetical protein